MLKSDGMSRRSSTLIRAVFLACAMLLHCIGASVAADVDELVIDSAETSGLDGRDWNKAFPGGKTVDAVHRSVLLRFPGASEMIAARLRGGAKITAAEIHLDYAGYELAPDGYVVRNGMGKDAWQKNPPSWHILAAPIRLPWKSDAAVGPTYTSRINGRAPWSELGAASLVADRFPLTFPPAELSIRSPVAHIDISALLNSEVAASDLGSRLRLLEECGFVLTKLEAYDSRYRAKGESYEWAMPTGGHGLTFDKPRLVIHFASSDRPGSASPLVLPLPVDFASMISTLQQRPPRLPDWDDPARFEALRPIASSLTEQKPDWMSKEQFEHVRQLLSIGGDSLSGWVAGLAAGNPKPYQAYMRELWRTPPRYWKGWSIQDDLLLLLQLSELAPDVIRKHVATYWRSWLMPDIPTSQLFHPQGQEAYDYAIKSGDWRGRASFFRAGYNYAGSTQNFNHTAAIGALLGGELTNADAAMADGRNGLEKLLLRYWAFNDGSSQEMLDHYYLSITLSGQKMLADFGPTAFDRLAGRIMLERTLEMLATLYHPEMKRLIGPSGRARMSGVLVEQDGIYGALHALSSKGTLKYLDQPFRSTVHAMPVWGYDYPPGRVGLQSLSGPWAPSWFSQTIDDKRFPFWEISTETVRSNFNPPLWRRSYLGHHYGLASQDIKGGTADVLAQWARDEQASTSLEGLGTLTARYCVNICDLAATNGGTIPLSGTIATFQHKNRAIIATRPPVERSAIESLAGKDGLKELAAVLALWNFAQQPTWEIYVDGVLRQPSELPIHLKFGQLVTLKDGQSFLAIRPLPATDLGRDGTEAVIQRGGYGGKTEGASAPIEPALMIVSYNLKRQGPVDAATLDWETITKGSVSGFVIELGDLSEYENFGAFQMHAQSATLETVHYPEDHAVDVSYMSGGEAMTARFGTDVPQLAVHFPIKPGTQTRAIQDRRVNGQRPYLPIGLERDTSWSQQGTSGHLEKNGAVLETERGRKAYLIADQDGAGVLAYNPVPDPTSWELSLPDGRRIKADGRVGLMRVAFDRDAHTLDIDHAARDKQQAAGLAKSISITGLQQPMTIRVCGKPAIRREIIDSAGGTATIAVDIATCAP